VDEVLATAQYLWRSKRAGRSFWRTLLFGGPALSEARDPVQGLDMPFGQVVREFLRGGVTYPWALLAATFIGICLLCTPVFFRVELPLYFSDHVAGCLVVLIAVTAWAEVARPVRLLNVPLGLWVAASPFVLGDSNTAALISNLLAGLGLAALSLPRGTRSQEHYGGWDRYIV
jgi:hypothetical protein